MTKQKPIPLTKGQVIAQKLQLEMFRWLPPGYRARDVRMSHIAALIDSELDKKEETSGKADNADAVHSKSPEQTGGKLQKILQAGDELQEDYHLGARLGQDNLGICDCRPGGSLF